MFKILAANNAHYAFPGETGYPRGFAESCTGRDFKVSFSVRPEELFEFGVGDESDDQKNPPVYTTSYHYGFNGARGACYMCVLYVALESIALFYLFPILRRVKIGALPAGRSRRRP